MVVGSVGCRRRLSCGQTMLYISFQPHLATERADLGVRSKTSNKYIQVLSYRPQLHPSKHSLSSSHLEGNFRNVRYQRHLLWRDGWTETFEDMPRLVPSTVMAADFATIHEVKGSASPKFRNPFSNDKTPINVAHEHARHREDRLVKELAGLELFSTGARGEK